MVTFAKQEAITVTEAISRLQVSQVSNESKIFSLSELEYQIAPDGDLEVTIPGEAEPLRTSETAVDSFCKNAGIPRGYYEKCDHTLRGTNLRRRLNLNSQDRRLMINRDLGLIRGVVPVPYTEVSHDTLLTGLLPGTNSSDRKEPVLYPMQEIKDRETLISMPNVSWRVVMDPMSGASMDPSNNHMGLMLRTSDLGEWLHVYPILWRQVCSNGLIVQTASSDSPYRVSYKGLDVTVARGLVSGVRDAWSDKAHVFADLVSRLETQTFDIEGADKFFQQLRDLKVSASFLKKMREVYDQRQVDLMPKWDLVNLITREAQDLTEDSQVKVEAAVAEVLDLVSLYQSV